ncbi:MAG: hypothetical protein AAF430_20550 [Myxococcota bacterium]
MTLRFNHMELTVPRGTLDAKTRAEIGQFYGEVFGWETLDVPILGQEGLLLRTDPETSQFVLVVESRRPVRVPGFDHLGLLLDTRVEVDRAFEAVKRWQERDIRVETKEYDDLDQGAVTVHAFYVRFLLPLWFDVQCMEWADGHAPERSWHYG